MKPVPISKRIVLINSISSVTTRILTVGVFAWVIQYLLKRIPEEELALLPVVMSLAMVLPVLQTILSGGLSRFVTEAYAKNDLEGVTKIVSSQFPLLLGTGILSLLLGSLVAWYIDRILTIPTEFVGQARLMMFMIVARMAIGVTLAPFTTGLVARQRFGLQNMFEILSSLLRIVLMLGFIFLFGPRVEYVVGAQIASQLFYQFAITIASICVLPALRFRPDSFDWQTCKRVLSFSGWNFVSEAAALVRRAADAPILNQLANAVAVNDFFLGATFDTQLRQMSITAGQPLMPALTAMHAHEQYDRLAAAFLRGGRIALWASMFLATPAIIFGYDLFALYLGSAYREHVDAASVMIILLLGFPLIYPTMMFVRICHAQGNVRPIAIRSVFGNLANLALTLILVGPCGMGAIGSAIATLLACFSHPLVFWPLALRTLNITWRKFLTDSLVPGLFPAVVAGFVGLAAAPMFASVVIRVCVGVPFVLAVYAIAVYFMFQPADRADLGRIRQRFGFRQA